MKGNGTHVVRLDRAEWEILRWDGQLGQQVEGRTLSNVRESDDTDLHNIIFVLITPQK